MHILLTFTLFMHLVFAGDYDKGFYAPSKPLRICVVEGRGTYKKAAQYCPTLEKTSNLECVIGIDRLDCLRKIQKGTAHFGVFSPEDLVAARWSGAEILITDELRYHNEYFEYQVVAVVDNEAGINTAQDLKGSKFCHPGHGIENHWTEVLANYFEIKLVARQCEVDISPIESRIKATASFFGPSCKAGPWVSDPIEDRRLKNKYPSLCQLCYNPYQCSIGDKHWGRRGPLYCLTSGAGEVAWARLDDVKSHFGFSGIAAEADPAGYSFLCPDGHLQPLNAYRPCVWLSKPWPSIGAQRNVAAKVQEIVAKLTHDDTSSWQNALLMLLETYHVNVTTLDNTIPIDDYLDQAVGFQDAYSFQSCNPPRSIVYCTSSLIELAKCSWLQEVSSVFGVEPNIQCIRAESKEKCLDYTSNGVAEVVLVDQDDRLKAQSQYNLKPILYEYSSQPEEKYMIVAVTHKKSGIKTISDLRGKKACFPQFEGAAFLSVIDTMLNHSDKIDICTDVKSYFSTRSCNWRNRDQCNDKYNGDEGAFRCLVDGHDVAFVDFGVYNKIKEKTFNASWVNNIINDNYNVLCLFGTADTKQICHLSWVPRGHIMIRNSTEDTRLKEIYNSLREMDRLFGKQYRIHSHPFTLFGQFDKKHNVMFRDQTESFRGKLELYKDRTKRLLDGIYNEMANRKCSINSRAWYLQSSTHYIYFVITILIIYTCKLI